MRLPIGGREQGPEGPGAGGQGAAEGRSGFRRFCHRVLVGD